MEITGHTRGTTIANQANITIIAQDPGDILAAFFPATEPEYESVQMDEVGLIIPLKAFSSIKTFEYAPLYGVGSLQPFTRKYKTVRYTGSFVINSWVSEEEKAKFDRMMYEQADHSGAPYEFDMGIYDRVNAVDHRGQPDRRSGNIVFTDTNIILLKNCILTRTDIEVGEPGEPIAVKYEYDALRRIPR